MANPKIRRWKKHVANLNRILKDDRISGSRRLLAQTLAMWIDAEDDDRKTLSLVLIGTFGFDPRRVWWKEDDEEGVPEPETTRLDLDTRKQLRDVFADIFNDVKSDVKEENAVHPTDV